MSGVWPDTLWRTDGKKVATSRLPRYKGRFEPADCVFSDDWQVLEERVDGAAAAERQFVWGPNYVDELVLRDRDADASGGNGLEERLYAVHDGLYSVTALVNAAGAVQERFAYTPYGESMVLDANVATDSDGASDFAWETRFTGREFDAETGLYHYRRRVYHVQLGQFVIRDPARYIDGPRLYAAHFAPNGLDPSGMTCRIGLHCWNVVRLGIPFGRHCGLTIESNVVPFRPRVWLDGMPSADGRCLELQAGIGADDPDAHVELPPGFWQGDLIAAPQSVCECLANYMRRISGRCIPYSPAPSGIGVNSNCALNCMATRCSFNIDWGGAGEPVGYSCRICQRRGCTDSGSPMCLEYGNLQCP